uniref:Putative secreted protein n=1 Tax=Anopheles darlingi TaxID=43151 RepID=A0A2M4DDU2_ANODA
MRVSLRASLLLVIRRGIAFAEAVVCPYLVGTALSWNGSKDTVIRWTAFRLTSFNCFPIADTIPPDRRNAPPTFMDILSSISRFPLRFSVFNVVS